MTLLLLVRNRILDIGKWISDLHSMGLELNLKDTGYKSLICSEIFSQTKNKVHPNLDYAWPRL